MYDSANYPEFSVYRGGPVQTGETVHPDYFSRRQCPRIVSRWHGNSPGNRVPEEPYEGTCRQKIEGKDGHDGREDQCAIYPACSIQATAEGSTVRFKKEWWQSGRSAWWRTNRFLAQKESDPFGVDRCNTRQSCCDPFKTSPEIDRLIQQRSAQRRPEKRPEKRLERIETGAGERA